MTTEATPREVGSHAGLGLVPERVAFEAWKRKQGGHYMSRNNAPGSDLNGYQDAHTQGQWEAWQAAVAAERERCATMLEREVDLSGLNNQPTWQRYTADLLNGCAAWIRRA